MSRTINRPISCSGPLFPSLQENLTLSLFNPMKKIGASYLVVQGHETWRRWTLIHQIKMKKNFWHPPSPARALQHESYGFLLSRANQVWMFSSKKNLVISYGPRCRRPPVPKVLGREGSCGIFVGAAGAASTEIAAGSGWGGILGQAAAAAYPGSPSWWMQAEEASAGPGTRLGLSSFVAARGVSRPNTGLVGAHRRCDVLEVAMNHQCGPSRPARWGSGLLWVFVLALPCRRNSALDCHILY
jgi:hypothetical protein